MKRLTTKLATLLFFIAFFSANLIAEDIVKNAKSTTNDLLIAQMNTEKYLYGIVLENQEGSGSGTNQKAGLGVAGNPRLKIINLGPIVNTSADDYAPTVTADGKMIYFVSNRVGSKELPNGKLSTDFWAFTKQISDDTVIVEGNRPFNIDPSADVDQSGVNTVLHEGVASISGDGKTLYFTGCNRPDGYGDCDIYKVTLRGDQWGKPINLGRNVNSEYFDSQPSISPDESRLYFVSTRPGPNSSGKNKHDEMDIWYSDWDDNLDEWKPAQNLSQINTKGKDCSPFICADGRTLIFSSDGLPGGFGGLDFYYTVYNPSTRTWSSPQNMGQPLNTRFDEQFLSMTADGKVVYFSSTRSDLPGYQGGLDLFMGVVPTYPRTILITGTVRDDCTDELIPATVSMSNKLTGRTVENTYSEANRTFSHIITFEDFGPNDLEEIEIDITSTHARFGSKTVTQKVKRHPDVEDPSVAAINADTITLRIPMGERPQLIPVIAEAEYITKAKVTNPAYATWRGLVMEEILNWSLYPLLSYVFFEDGSSEIPSRYQRFRSSSETRIFSDTTIAGGTLSKYYHILNIYGFRLTMLPNETIEIVGCNNQQTEGEKRAGLSKERADNVYNYLRDVWNISPDRMKLVYRDLPNTPSNRTDSLGMQENRRVELVSKEWEVFKPIFDKDLSRLPQPDDMVFNIINGIDDDIVASRKLVIKRGETVWRTLTDIGTTDPTVEWDWTDEEGRYPTDNTPYTAQLIITTRSGAICTSEPVDIPTLQVSTQERVIAIGEEKTMEDYSLILFPFGSAEAGPVNERVMRDYVYGRVFPTSDITVTGHTDIVGLYETNIRLSERRAATVRAGIQRSSSGRFKSMSVKGVGPENPLYPNDMPEGRFYNRTVHVQIESVLRHGN
jgi:outer membrane protein OmpA-like peptidoglycan-associated protein